MFPPERCDDRAWHTLRRLVDRSRRQRGLQVPASFLRGTGADPAPLAQMLSAGKGGDVRIKLYLSTVLLAGGVNEHPVHGANVVHDAAGAFWARALALQDPSGRGARHVAAAQSWLHHAKLFRVERRPGREPLVRLRSADGQGRPWHRPTAPYLTVPIELWTQHWVWFLNAKELAVLLALLDLQGERGLPSKPEVEPQWMATEDNERYGFSPDTWRLAAKSLANKGIVHTDFQGPVSRDFETPRRRKTYWVNRERLAVDALEALNPLDDSTAT